MTEMTPEQAQEVQDEYLGALEEMQETWEAFQEAYENFRYAQAQAHPEAAPSWRAYHDAQVQGEERGWLGGPFLADVIAKAVEDAG